ncbi:MAG: SDR family NAD(P)-dependent oxidoreductase, partial [Bacteroidetes bacterium]|nr:SDR family NAD(P)-dependent oxidoreductase [Bacteroidota bacterium]
MKNRSLNNQTVLITGASSGIGFATAIYFDNIGIKVYAGVRKESDGERLKEHEINNITPVILDVCDYPSIQRAFDLIKKK